MTKKKLTEKGKKELVLKMIDTSRRSIIHTIYSLQTEESLGYLDRKAQILLEKEQHALGNTGFRSIFTDPDLDGKKTNDQEPGG